MALVHAFYGGNGTTSVDSGLPLVGVIYGVGENGELYWYRYEGNGEKDRKGIKGWHPNSGHQINREWQRYTHVLGCGDGIILGVRTDGKLIWHKYSGNGKNDPKGEKGWHENSGHEIGHGWQNFRHVFVTPQEGRSSSSRLTIYGVEQNGNLRWYSYHGNGEEDNDGIKNWDDKSGNVVGNGWHHFKHIFGSGNVIFGIDDNGALRWYSYHGNGEEDYTGIKNWHSNSGHQISQNWLNFRTVFGGTNDSDGFGHVIYSVQQKLDLATNHQAGDLLWHRYEGNGEKDPNGTSGWMPHFGNVIGNGW